MNPRDTTFQRRIEGRQQTRSATKAVVDRLRRRCLDLTRILDTCGEVILGKEIQEARNEASSAVSEFIENFYNAERMHSALDYFSPIEYEERTAAQAA